MVGHNVVKTIVVLFEVALLAWLVVGILSDLQAMNEVRSAGVPPGFGPPPGYLAAQAIAVRVAAAAFASLAAWVLARAHLALSSRSEG